MTDIIYKEESYAILGACFNVYNDKGCGFLEPVYQECCKIEFIHQDIPHFAQKELQLTYRGQVLKQRYKPDFVSLFLFVRIRVIRGCLICLLLISSLDMKAAETISYKGLMRLPIDLMTAD